MDRIWGMDYEIRAELVDEKEEDWSEEGKTGCLTGFGIQFMIPCIISVDRGVGRVQSLLVGR